MKSQKITDSFKNAMGTIFLLAGAFFVCSTLFSIRTVFADPIAPVNDGVAYPQSQRASNSSRSTARSTSRSDSERRNTQRARTTVARPGANAGAAVRNAPARDATSRATAQRTIVQRAAVQRVPAANAVKQTASGRNVISRQAAAINRASLPQNPRAVRARTAVVQDNDVARISLTGSAIRGSTKTTSSTYSYLTNRLYTGNYSNIIDSTTGLISNDAYNNCLESYYVCMDEICTARNEAQGRCACAGRVKAFAEAEAALETANEELIKVSGELALLISSKGKGKEVAQAFQLTDAEKVMNCVSWREASKDKTATAEEFGDWCKDHGIYDETCSVSKAPEYCENNTFGFDLNDLQGSGSDILALLKAQVTARDSTLTILKSDNEALTSAYDNMTNIVNGLSGITGALSNTEESKDSLAETWGYELFEYAHNNVCARVLDSCFNGIYEACGTPPTNRKCSNGASQCPYNYNSIISVNNTGSYELNFVTPNGGYSASNSATCFGYTTTTGDPYSELRGPVADARRSIMQKYALDANADCDVYGEQLRAQAQNIGYQKVAAQQALQQKRQEFYIEEQEEILNAAIDAGTNFNECISEIYDCYQKQLSTNEDWTDARIKTYCAQIASVPHCYDEMICNPSSAQFKAVIDVADSNTCNNSKEYETNTCRNVVTLNEILNGTGAKVQDGADLSTSQNSAEIREKCLQDAGVQDLRDWFKK